MFPQVRKAMGRKELQELGRQMQDLKQASPTRPHPPAPDEPPANLVAGPMAAVMDAGKDVAGAAVRKVTRRSKRS